MSALTSLLARDGVVSVQAIEDALQRQVLEGGEIDTALLELRIVPENTLNAYRAAALRAAPATREELTHVSDDILKRVPRELADRLRVVPLGQDGATLWVCASAPLASAAVRQLEEAVQQKVSVKVAVEVRVEAALATFYGIQIADRMRSLAEALDQVPAGALPHVRTLVQSGPPGSSRRPSRVPRAGDNQVLHIDPALRLAYAADRPAVSAIEGRDGWADTARETNSAFPPPPGRGRGSMGPAAGPTGLWGAFKRPAGGAIDPPAAMQMRSAARPNSRRSIVPKGPLTAERARGLLDVVQDRDDVVDVLFAFARQYFDCAFFFAVRSERLFLLEQHGVAVAEPVGGAGWPIASGGAIDDMMRSMLPRVSHLGRAAEDRVLAEALGRLGAQPAVLLPLAIRQRVVSLLYGDRNGEPLILEELSEVLGLLPKAVRSLERIIRNRKLYASRAGEPLSKRPPEDRGGEPDASEGDVGAARTEPSLSAAEPDTAEVVQPGGDPFGASPGPPPSEVMTTLGLSRPAPPLPDLSQPRPPETVSFADRSPPQRWAALVPGAYWGALGSAEMQPKVAYSPTKPPPGAGVYRSIMPGTVDDLSDSVSAFAEERPTAVVGGDPAAAARRGAGGTLSQFNGGDAGAGDRGQPPSPAEVLGGAGVVVPVRTVGVSGAGGVQALPVRGGAEDPRSAPTPVPYVRPRKPAYGSEPQPDAWTAPPQAWSPGSADMVTVRSLSEVPSTERREPSVIIDLGSEIDRLVDELGACAPDEEGTVVAALLRLGRPAVTELSARFPGPLWFDRQAAQQRLPRGRDVSALARALSAFGRSAVPEVARLMTGAPSADVRCYAALLSADRVDPGYLVAYEQAVFDPDPQVRLVVRDALFNCRGQEGFSDVMATLMAIATDDYTAVLRRLDAIEAISAAREPAALDLLIDLNALPERQLAVPAHRALMCITAHDFGDSTKRWRAFVRTLAGRHRAEWLIDGLMQVDERMRAVAGDELQRLTRQYFGFVATASKRDRERVQRRYREWWDAEGSHFL